MTGKGSIRFEMIQFVTIWFDKALCVKRKELRMENDNRQLAVGKCLLIIDYLMFVVGYTLLAIGYLTISVTGCAHQKHAPLGLNMNNPG